MNDDTARAPRREQAKLRVERLSFSEIPHQSRLFLDYVNDPSSLKKYYPNAVTSVSDLGAYASGMLAEYRTDRGELCSALEIINRDIDAGAGTFDNIERLRDPRTVAVVSGQQAGLFTGPLYTIYKALSAIRAAEQLSASGTPAVPVFWIASEDHDFAEVDETFFVGSSADLVRSEYQPKHLIEGGPVGEVKIDASIASVIEGLTRQLPDGVSSAEVHSMLENSWSAGSSFAAGFAKNLAIVLQTFGVIFVDPLNDGLKQLVSPVYVAAIQHADAMLPAVQKRSMELEGSGYHAQVLVEEDHFPLFWHTDQGRRLAIRRSGDGNYRAKGEEREFTLAELAAVAQNEPRRFSPGVMLRPVVQDHLLPTICYFGGAAEIAYFAQNSAAYRVLGRPVTPILHRQSFTVVEPKHARTFEKLEIGLTDMFKGIDAVVKKAVERSVAPATAGLFAEVEEKIAAELSRLDRELSRLDPTLAANLSTRQRKILYHIAALKKKAYHAQIAKAETADRQINSAFNSLLPKGELQERVINVHSFLNKYGPVFVDWLYEAVDLDDRGHRVLYI